jgi:hypothetical protein
MADLPLDAVILEAEVTLATIREWAESMHRTATAVPPAPLGHAAGFDCAVRDVLAILDSRHAPQGVPVHLPAS